MDERHGGGTRIRDDVSDFEIRRADKIVCGSRVSHVNVFFFFFTPSPKFNSTCQHEFGGDYRSTDTFLRV
jgi:hypothetical protein